MNVLVSQAQRFDFFNIFFSILIYDLTIFFCCWKINSVNKKKSKREKKTQKKKEKVKRKKTLHLM